MDKDFVYADNCRPWTAVIRPNRGWFGLNLSELWQYRELVGLLVARDFMTIYKQTILGPLWFLLQPLLTTIVFTVIFGHIAGIPTDGVPHLLFYMSGTVIWNYFANCINSTSNTFINNSALFGKVYFPRMIVPISSIFSNLITFLIQFLLFLGIWAMFYLRGADVSFGIAVLLLPFLLVQSAFLGLAVGIIVSSLTTRYRDLTYLVSFGVQLWMFASPVVYPSSAVPAKYQTILLLNPVTPIIDSFRHAFLGTGELNVGRIFLSMGISFFLLLIGVCLFNRVEKSFMDTV